MRDHFVVAEIDGDRRADIAVLLGVVLALGVPSVGLLLWAEAREYSDNQRNLAYLGGWLGVGAAVTMLLITAAVFTRSHGLRNARLGLAAGGAAVSALLIAAAFALTG